MHPVYFEHMKTTIDIASNILNRSRKLARDQKVTLRALVEEGLELVLQKRGPDRQRPEVRPVTYSGKGLAPEFKGASWERIRDAAYGANRP
jgi:hypothetical protein